MSRLLPRPPRCRYRTAALQRHPPSLLDTSHTALEHIVMQSRSFNDARVQLNVIKVRILEVRNLDLESNGDALVHGCIDVRAHRYRCTDVKMQRYRRKGAQRGRFSDVKIQCADA